VPQNGEAGGGILAEVTALEEQVAYLIPYSEGKFSIGDKVFLESDNPAIYPSDAFMGRVINAFGKPIDGKGSLAKGRVAYPLKNSPPISYQRQEIGGKMDVGVKAINSFITLCKGQRMGVFAGSGVGKSMLIAMLTKYAKADVKVIGLIGERGREVKEFLNDYLGEDGMKNAVIIASTSDESPLARKRAAYLTLAVAEYFRDAGKEVLLMMDSVTRFAMAQREIGLASGEPIATKGYTTSVFVELPKLLERAGCGVEGSGNITAIFTVLVEGGDTDEPISDTVRGILDGHIMLSRNIADRGRYPAIDVNKSVSRTMPKCNTSQETELVTKARRYMAVYYDMEEIIRIGAYKSGSDKLTDEAIYYSQKLEEFLSQKSEEHFSLEKCYEILQDILAS
jgi:flagellum-specific ATP synthase